MELQTTLEFLHYMHAYTYFYDSSLVFQQLLLWTFERTVYLVRREARFFRTNAYYLSVQIRTQLTNGTNLLLNPFCDVFKNTVLLGNRRVMAFREQNAAI